MKAVWLRGTLIVVMAMLSPLAEVLGKTPLSWEALHSNLTWGSFISALVAGCVALRAYLDQSLSRAQNSTN